MNTAIAIPGSAATFLTHLFGQGLTDDRYVVEKFRAFANGGLRRCPNDAPTKGESRRRAKFVTATLKAVQAMRPARNEIIVCTGLRTRGGMQIWGEYAIWGHMLRR